MSEGEGRPLVLGILGSPRGKSNTGALLERVLAGAASAGAETDLVRLRELKFRSCLHCGGCDKTGECVVDDSMQRIYPRLHRARHLALASPIHFAGVSGETKMMIDRAQCLWVAKYRLRKPMAEGPGERRGLFIASCGGKDERVFAWAKPAVKAFFNSAGFRYWGELFEANTDDPPPVWERAAALARAEELGRALAAETAA